MNLHQLKPAGYNNPCHGAMLISQWNHQGFLWGWWSYERYEAMQNVAYIALQQRRAAMMGQLQDPQHVVPSIIVGLLLSSGWEVGYNDTQDPYIHHVSGQFSTFSTWWDCLKAIIETASE